MASDNAADVFVNGVQMIDSTPALMADPSGQEFEYANDRAVLATDLLKGLCRDSLHPYYLKNKFVDENIIAIKLLVKKINIYVFVFVINFYCFFLFRIMKEVQMRSWTFASR